MAGLNATLKRWTAATRAISKIIECPVCLDPIDTQFKLCSRGHACCSKCVTRLTCCPTCEGDFIIENPVMVRNLLEALPKLCRYAVNGCGDINELGNDHQIYCGYRLVTCREDYCGENVAVCKLSEHYTSHPKRYIVYEENESMISPDIDLEEDYKDDLPVYLFDTFFWLTITNITHEKQLQFGFEVVHIDKPDYEYYVIITFVAGKHIYSNTLKAADLTTSVKREVQNKVASPDSEKYKNEYGDDHYVIKIPQQALTRFIIKNEMEYNVEFFREKIN